MVWNCLPSFSKDARMRFILQETISIILFFPGRSHLFRASLFLIAAIHLYSSLLIKWSYKQVMVLVFCTFHKFFWFNIFYFKEELKDRHKHKQTLKQ